MKSRFLGALIVMIGLLGAGAAYAQPDASITIEDVGTVPGTQAILGGVDLDVPLDVREATGKAVDLSMPTLLGLTRDANGSQVTVTAAAVEVLRDGKPVTKLHLGPYERTNLIVRIEGLTEAGTYTAQIAVDTAATELKTPVTLKVRSSVVIAALLIALGVGLSAVLRYLIGTYRDAVRLRARIDLLGMRLKAVRTELGDLDGQAQPTADSVEGQLNELRLRQDSDTPPTAGEIDECGRKVSGLPSYIQCLRALSDVDDDAVRTNVLTVRQWLDADLDSDDIAAQRVAAGKALTDLAKAANALSGPLAAAINELRGRIEGLLTSSATTGRQDAIDILTPARAALDQASAALTSDIAEARKHYEMASQTYANAQSRLGMQMGALRALPPADTDKVGATIAVDVSNPLRRTGNRARNADTAVAVLVALIAVVLGLQLLWVTNLAWGSSLDMITAFLWGLGLQPVGGTVFGGLGALRDRIATPSTKG